MKDHPQSPAAAEALYDAAWRRAALIEIYKNEPNQKKSAESKDRALSLAQRIVSQYGQSRLGLPRPTAELLHPARHCNLRERELTDRLSDLRVPFFDDSAHCRSELASGPI